MSKKQKRKDRFLTKPRPKDYAWDELVRFMDDMGFDLDDGGGTSHCHFVCRENRSLVTNACKPHGGDPSVKPYKLKEIEQFLKELGKLS